MKKIAIIDTGVDLQNKYIKGTMFHGVYCCRKDDGFSAITTKDDIKCIQDNVGHGTAIMKIILEHNADAEFYIVKIYNTDSEPIDEEVLLFALRYVYENTDCDLINISLGITIVKRWKDFYQLCSLYRNDGRMIVAAFDNRGALSFPATLDNVFGVSSFEGCNRNSYYLVYGSPVNILSYGGRQRVSWINNETIFGYGNSYACAHFSGIVSKCNEIFLSERFCDWLNKNAKDIFYNEENRASNHLMVNNYKKAVLFPFNKEMHSLVRFSDMLQFELVDVYETKYSARVSAHTNSLMRENCPKDYIIKNIDSIDWDSFDTFIMGHVEDYFGRLEHIINFRELIKEIVQKGKYLYMLDDYRKYISNDIDISNIYSPFIDSYNVPKNRFGKLYKIELPVLGVFGTGSKQGKFTLQLNLRKKFLGEGYKVTQIGTEPTAPLYGMDIVFPVGFNSSVYVSQYDTVRYLNDEIWKHSRGKDIVIIGGQSGVIPADDVNTNYFNFTTFDLLYATMPDAFVLTVFLEDDINVVMRTIKLLEAISGGIVLAIVVFPVLIGEMGIKIEERVHRQFDNLKSKLEQYTTIPVFRLDDDSEINILFDKIVDFFHESILL